MKRQQASRALVPFLSVLVSLCPHAARAQTSTASYCAPLLASEVVAPHVNTNARGLADFTFTESDSAWTGNYNITIYNASNIHSVEAHQAPRAALGDLVYYFYGPVDNPSLPGINGVLLEGNIDPAQFKGPLRGKGVKDMRDRADDGDLYILVITAQNPNGELRGQLVPASTGTCSLPPAPTPAPAPGPVPAQPQPAAAGVQPQKAPPPVPAPKPAAAQSPIPEPVPAPKPAAPASPVPEPVPAPKPAAAASPSPAVPAAPPKLPPSPSPGAAAATSPAPKPAASPQPVPGPTPSPPP